jgi:hypothetical protein
MTHLERTAAIASRNPAWASEITSSTPDRPRATRSRRNAVQPAPSSTDRAAGPGSPGLSGRARGGRDTRSGTARTRHGPAQTGQPSLVDGKRVTADSSARDHRHHKRLMKAEANPEPVSEVCLGDDVSRHAPSPAVVSCRQQRDE